MPELANDHASYDLSLIFLEDSESHAAHTHIERGRVAQKSFRGLHLIDHRHSNWPSVEGAAEESSHFQKTLRDNIETP